MTDDNTTRNFGARPGYDLHDSIDLDGWHERSIWGYDDTAGSFYAQLWRNPGAGDAPDIWLSGLDPSYPWPGSIALAVLDATRSDPVSVVRALGLANPHATPRPIEEVVHAATPLISQSADPYAAGKLAALNWMIGVEGRAPGSWLPWTGQRPTPEQVTAEYMITGRIYQPLDAHTRAWAGGVDEALNWALGGE